VFVLTCDNVTDLDFQALPRLFRARRARLLLVPVTPVPGIDGDYIFHDGSVVTELARDRPAETYGSGIQVLNPARIKRLCSGEGDFSGVWNELIADRHLYMSSVRPQKWFRRRHARAIGSLRQAISGRLMTPTVSVILNCYNHEPYVAEAVESVLTQTFDDFELNPHRQRLDRRQPRGAGALRRPAHPALLP
jgi:NDP-sugar pyrophosphorylase family protein